MEVVKKAERSTGRVGDEEERKEGEWREERRESEPKEQEAEEPEGASRVEQWPKIAGQNQRGIKGIAERRELR